MYNGYLTDINGIKVGHASYFDAGTGTTVVLLGNGMTAGVDVRGSAPGTRETDLLSPYKMIDKVHAIVLTGGSAFGLDACGGVMKFLEEQNIGHDVGPVKVPIVCGAVIFDLLYKDHKIRPDESLGYLAAKNASTTENKQGCVGAGTGATVGKILGMGSSMKSGIGSSTVTAGKLKVSALVCVNAFGDIYDSFTNKRIAGVKHKENFDTIDIMKSMVNLKEHENKNTTIGVVATNASFDKAMCTKIAQLAQNGLARSIRPVHTMYDGDTIFAVSGDDKIEADVSLVGLMADEAVSRAIANAIYSI